MDQAGGIRHNVEAVNARIADAAARSGRTADAVTLIAVTKTVGADKIAEAYAAGVRHFGENRVQELMLKRSLLDLGCTWHMIGHLQSNKVRDALRHSALIHSVDSLALGAELDRRAAQAGAPANVLAQVNISREDTKSGIDAADAESFVVALSAFSRLNILGLMAIASPAQDPESVRPEFRRMKQAFDRVAANAARPNVRMLHLSMGMSNDFEVAVEEGSTMVRVGSAIFGARQFL